MQKVLTDAYLRALAPPAMGRLEISDTRCGGLVLRVTANGAKSWSFRFRDRTTQAPLRVTIGRYPEIGLSAAREAANGHRKTVSVGGNPAIAKRLSSGGNKSFGALADRYLDEYARRKKRSHAVDERNLKNHVLPKWKNRAYASIKRADVIELVEGLVGDSPTAANRVQSLISTVFTFALDAGLVDFNPCHRLRRRGQENVGRRVLTDPEIRLFWNRYRRAAPEPPRWLGLAACIVNRRPRWRTCGNISGGIGPSSRAGPRCMDHPRSSRKERARPSGAPLANGAGDRPGIAFHDQQRGTLSTAHSCPQPRRAHAEQFTNRRNGELCCPTQRRR